jgi:hypothetical protein
MAHFDVPRNLPHAATVTRRIAERLRKLGAEENPDAEDLFESLNALEERLFPFELEENGVDPVEEAAIAEQAAGHARRVVDEIEKLAIATIVWARRCGTFECLGHGEEGAAISLRAGENPAP